MRRVAPGGQPHALLPAIRALDDDLGGGAPLDGEMHLVLHGGEKRLRCLRLRALVHRGRVDVGDFLVEPPLTGADFANLGQQVVVILRAQKRAVLEPLLVQHIAPEGEGAQHSDGPLTELDGASRVHPETDRDDGVEVIMIHVAGDIAPAFPANHPEIPDSCLTAQFTGLIDVAQVLIDGANIHLKECGHEFLGMATDQRGLKAGTEGRRSKIRKQKWESGKSKSEIGNWKKSGNHLAHQVAHPLPPINVRALATGGWPAQPFRRTVSQQMVGVVSAI